MSSIDQHCTKTEMSFKWMKQFGNNLSLICHYDEYCWSLLSNMSQGITWISVLNIQDTRYNLLSNIYMRDVEYNNREVFDKFSIHICHDYMD